MRRAVRRRRNRHPLHPITKDQRQEINAKISLTAIYKREETSNRQNDIWEVFLMETKPKFLASGRRIGAKPV